MNRRKFITTSAAAAAALTTGAKATGPHNPPADADILALHIKGYMEREDADLLTVCRYVGGREGDGVLWAGISEPGPLEAVTNILRSCMKDSYDPKVRYQTAWKHTWTIPYDESKPGRRSSVFDAKVIQFEVDLYTKPVYVIFDYHTQVLDHFKARENLFQVAPVRYVNIEFPES